MPTRNVHPPASDHVSADPWPANSTHKIEVIGLGAPHGDDRAGWLVAERIQKMLLNADGRTTQLQVRACRSPLEILDALDAVERLVLCDACRGIGVPGTWKKWNRPSDDWQRAEWSGTHDGSIPSVLELAESLHILPARTEVWGIELQTAELFAEVSPAVSSVIGDVADAIWRDLGHA